MSDENVAWRKAKAKPEPRVEHHGYLPTVEECAKMIDRTLDAHAQRDKLQAEIDRRDEIIGRLADALSEAMKPLCPKGSKCSACEERKALVAEARKVSAGEWIPVSERLPDSSDLQCYVNVWRNQHEEVIAWQPRPPMPEPWKGSAE